MRLPDKKQIVKENLKKYRIFKYRLVYFCVYILINDLKYQNREIHRSDKVD